MTDPREQQYEAERETLAAAIHKAMTSSYIGPPRPRLLGDADRAAAAVVTAGWQPPAEVEQLRAQLAERTAERDALQTRVDGFDKEGRRRERAAVRMFASAASDDLLNQRDAVRNRAGGSRSGGLEEAAGMLRDRADAYVQQRE